MFAVKNELGFYFTGFISRQLEKVATWGIGENYSPVMFLYKPHAISVADEINNVHLLKCKVVELKEAE